MYGNRQVGKHKTGEIGKKKSDEREKQIVEWGGGGGGRQRDGLA